MRRWGGRPAPAYPRGWQRLGGAPRPAAAPVHPHLRPRARRELPAAVKPAVLTAATNLLLALPSHAEAGKIFGERRWAVPMGRPAPRAGSVAAAAALNAR